MPLQITTLEDRQVIPALKIESFWGVVNHNIDGRSHLSIGHHQHGPICYRDAFVEVRLLAGSAS